MRIEQIRAGNHFGFNGAPPLRQDRILGMAKYKTARSVTAVRGGGNATNGGAPAG